MWWLSCAFSLLLLQTVAVRPEADSSEKLSVSVRDRGSAVRARSAIESDKVQGRQVQSVEPQKESGDKPGGDTPHSSDQADGNHDDNLSVKELQEMYTRMPPGVSSDTVHKLLSELDGNKDHISQERFAALTSGHRQPVVQSQGLRMSQSAEEFASTIRTLAKEDHTAQDIDSGKLQDILQNSHLTPLLEKIIVEPLHHAKESNGKININRFVEYLMPRLKILLWSKHPEQLTGDNVPSSGHGA
jgi:Ca2+-binding EF-hand superfamily protein